MQNDVADSENTVLRPRESVPVSDVEKTVLRPRGDVMPPLPDGEDTVITMRDLPTGLPEDLERTTARVIPRLVELAPDDSAPEEDTVLTPRVRRGTASPEPLRSGMIAPPPVADLPGSNLPGSHVLDETIIRAPILAKPPASDSFGLDPAGLASPASSSLEDTIIRDVRAQSAPATTTAPPALVTPPSQSPAVPVYVQHYRFRVNNHDTAVPLDRPAYVGRKPGTPRIHSGDVPRLVKVASPLQEVSSTHLEVRQRGGSVIVTDLQSTNGTTVVIPGSAPRKLRQGESLVVSPGTLIDIGDGNVIEILPIQRLL